MPEVCRCHDADLYAKTHVVTGFELEGTWTGIDSVRIYFSRLRITRIGSTHPQVADKCVGHAWRV